jgi:hypothetical protein
VTAKAPQLTPNRASHEPFVSGIGWGPFSQATTDTYDTLNWKRRMEPEHVLRSLLHPYSIVGIGTTAGLWPRIGHRHVYNNNNLYTLIDMW